MVFSSCPVGVDMQGRYGRTGQAVWCGQHLPKGWFTEKRTYPLVSNFVRMIMEGRIFFSKSIVK
jgi:hypothetical protein